jgi:hypothetical protein
MLNIQREIMAISIDIYNESERLGLINSIYPANRAFKPAAFSIANFPTRVSTETELFRYSDIMNELDDRKFFCSEKLYSNNEIELFKKSSEAVRSITKDLGRETSPYMSMFPPISVLRVLNLLTVNEIKVRPVNILEIGPGSGYLGSYIINTNHLAHFNKSSHPLNYCAVDNTQALYIWQNLFFSALELDFFDFADSRNDHLPKYFDNKVQMVPWWLFAEMYKSPPKVDIIVCDAALGEMDVFAANYVIRLAYEMLKDSNIATFLFRHIGEQRINPMSYIESRFNSSGFNHNEINGVQAYSLCDLNISNETETYNQIAGDHISFDKKLESYDFFDFLGLHR